jgi:glutamate dehydrogenase
MQNRMGSTFVFRLRDETGESASSIARAYSAAREMFDGRRLWSEIDSLDNKVAADVQIQMHLDVRNLLERATLWLLRNRRPPLDVETIVNYFAGGIANLSTAVPQLLPPAESEAVQFGRQRLIDAAVPEDLAQWIASLDLM